MCIHLARDDGPGIRFFFRELINLSFELVGLFAIQPSRLASPFWFDHPQSFKEQHTVWILLTHLDNGSGCFMSHIRVLMADVPPELLIAVFPLDRLAGLPLLPGNALEMAIAVSIEPLI